MTTDLSTEVEPHVWTMEEMLAACDPDRDYGSYQDLAGIKRAIERGEVRIAPPYEGATQPVLFDAANGRRIRGSGVPVPGDRIGTTPKIWAQSRFITRAAEDFDEVYKDLIDQCHNGNDRAIKLFFEMFLGPPKPNQDNPMSAMFKEMLDRLQQPQEAKYEVIEVRQ